MILSENCGCRLLYLNRCFPYRIDNMHILCILVEWIVKRFFPALFPRMVHLSTSPDAELL
jgi:hypothetical protein